MSGPTSAPLSRLVSEPGPRMTKAVVTVLRPLMRTISRHRWAGREHIPATGGFVLAANHISIFDPLVIAHFLVHAGRWPYFLAKSSLFSLPVVGTVVRRAEQIPVQRGTASAQQSLTAVYDAVRRGRAVVVYPEGTITADPHGWPGPARTGVARIALTTGCPVVPVGQWGAHRVLGMKKPAVPRLVPRPTICVEAGAPVDLEDLRGQPVTAAVLDQATKRILTAITTLVAKQRSETPPDEPSDDAAGRRQERERTSEQP